jgi:hypothetical protein
MKQQLPELAYQLSRFMGGQGPFYTREQRRAREDERFRQLSLRDHEAGMHAHPNMYDPNCSHCTVLTLVEHAVRYAITK